MTDVSPSQPVVSHRHSIVYTAMTSTIYTVICVVVIGILAAILFGLLFIYCRKIRGRYKYDLKTVRYSPVSTDVSEDESKKGRKRRGTNGSGRSQTGLAYDAAHYYTPSSSQHLWPSVPVSPHMDISAGHLLLNYIEANLQNQNKLKKEWESLQSYTPESTSTAIANQPENRPKNRYPDALPYDHTRVKLKRENNESGSDYINASFIVDVDPAHPKYIVTQGPLQNTITDFWQAVWEQDISVVVMLTTLTDMGLSQSCQYWPSSGVATYHTYEVRLVSEHPHSEDYIIRSFYLQNTRTQESRTVTHFQYLTWTSLGAPQTATPLLEFRRKVNKAHTTQDTPLLVHCSGGVGRTGTYCLIDMALTRIQSGAKELNLAATVEHLRDHRPHMVRTKAQFEFALAAVVEETHAMLDAASQRQRH